MTHKTYDVVIVGAGPAGANFARLINTDKYKVAIIDGSEGHDKVCGGLLSPDAQDVLARYDISLPCGLLASPQLFSVRTIDLANGYTRHYRRSYMNVDRAKFDNFMRSLIPQAVDLVGARCKRISKTGELYELETVSGDFITCKCVVGADGAASVVRNSLFKHKKIHKYIAIQQWFDAGQTNPYYSCIFDNDTSSGCSWVSFKDGMMIFGGAFDKENGREAFEAQKQKLIDLGFVEKEAFTNPTKTEACLVCRPHFSGGIFIGNSGAYLLGEAAGFISPSSFEGISYALSSAEALADAFNREPDIISHGRVARRYKNNTAKLIAKIQIRCIKRPFMYNKLLRRAVMKSGLTSITIRKTQNKH